MRQCGLVLTGRCVFGRVADVDDLHDVDALEALVDAAEVRRCALERHDPLPSYLPPASFLLPPSSFPPSYLVQVVVVFLSGSTVGGVERSDYMRSRNCLRELRRAIEAKKRIVFVNETDPQHGAVSMATHRSDCPEDLRHTLDEHLIVPWYRVKEYGQVMRCRCACPCRCHVDASCDQIKASPLRATWRR